MIRLPPVVEDQHLSKNLSKRRTVERVVAIPRAREVGEKRSRNWFRLGYLVHDVSRMRRTLYDQHLKKLGITRSQWWVLANISRSRSEEGVVSSTLARDIDVGKVTLSGIVDRLESAGYVFRRGDKKDKRAKRIFISAAGYALIEKMRDIIEPLNRRICDGMSDDEIRQTEEGLEKVKMNLRRMLGE